jgi:hypothetical protein
MPCTIALYVMYIAMAKLISVDRVPRFALIKVCAPRAAQVASRSPRQSLLRLSPVIE